MPSICGSRNVVTDLGMWQSRRCEHCAETRRFSVYLQYRWAHFYGVFGQVSWRSYSMICDQCGHGFELDPVEMRRVLPRDPIPWYQRQGWTVPACGLAGFLLFFLVLALS